MTESVSPGSGTGPSNLVGPDLNRLGDWVRHPALADLRQDSAPLWRELLPLDQVTVLGVAEADVRAVIHLALGRDPDEQEMAEFADALAAALVETAKVLPDLSVAAAIGWVLVGVAQDGRFASEAVVAWLTGAAPHEFDEDAVARLLAAVPGAADAVSWGWQFAAAGIEFPEASEQCRAGTVDWDAVETMAALRGVPRPATR